MVSTFFVFAALQSLVYANKRKSCLQMTLLRFLQRSSRDQVFFFLISSLKVHSPSSLNVLMAREHLLCKKDIKMFYRSTACC
jgi:hypothetical protein